MADATPQLNEYLKKITLSESDVKRLRDARDALEDVIKDSFRKNGRPKLNFLQQGSFDMHTIIRPLDGEFDLDYGVYLQGFNNNENNWPHPQTVRGWVIEAVKRHTATPPENRKACVRVIYAGNFHIDLPIYIETDTLTKLSHKEKGWISSKPKEITQWFQTQIKHHGEDLRNVVKILKGWSDYQSHKIGKMPSGLIITLLAVKHFTPNDRLDLCIYKTVYNIYNDIQTNFIIYNPVDSNEIVSNRLSQEVKERFKNALHSLRDALEQAANNHSIAESSQYWRDEFGDRFPIATEPSEKQKRDIQILIRQHDFIKPWGFEL